MGFVVGVLIVFAGLFASSISGFLVVIGMFFGAIVAFTGWAIGVLSGIGTQP